MAARRSHDREPPTFEPAPVPEVLPAPVQFDADESAVVFAQHWMGRPLSGRDSRNASRDEKVCARSAPQMRVDFPATVRHIVRSSCCSATSRCRTSRARLSMHRRTLDRHLQRHEITFGELLESVSENVARQLLHDTEMPIQQIADSVRFSSAANFATAFRRRLGITPSEYRRRIGSVRDRPLSRRGPRRRCHFSKSRRRHEPVRCAPVQSTIRWFP